MDKIARIGFGYGHTLSGSGGRVPEAKMNREVGQKVVELLKHGFDVVVAQKDSPNTYKGEDLIYRTNLVNDAKVDSYWEQHFNGYDGFATGTVTLRYPGTHANGKKSMMFAETMQNHLVTALKLKDRGISDRSDLYVLKNTNMPAIIMEPLFYDNPKDMERYNVYNIALAEAKAIYKCYGKDIYDYLTPEAKPLYQVVVGTFAHKENADELLKIVQQLGIDAYINTK